MRTFIAAAAASFVMLAGCTAPPAQYTSAKPIITEVPSAEGEDVKLAVMSSLRFLQWKILDEGDGFVIATARHKEQTATAKVSYSNDSYGIEYIDSDNLSGGATNHVYIRWVHALDNDIRAGLDLPRIKG